MPTNKTSPKLAANQVDRSAAAWHPTLRGARQAKAKGAGAAQAQVEQGLTVITREEFLAGRLVSLKKPDAHLPGVYSLRSELSCNACASSATPAPPPGLEHLAPSAEEKENQNGNEIATEAKPPPTQPKDYKVFLQNVPEMMLTDSMLQVMLDQAGLKDVTALAFRPNGKVLITFASYASVHKCINHFQGRKWGELPITANYVYVATGAASSKESKENRHSASDSSLKKTLNAKAPAFIPGAMSSTGKDKKLRKSAATRNRLVSDASTACTETGLESGTDGLFSKEMQAVCI